MTSIPGDMSEENYLQPDATSEEIIQFLDHVWHAGLDLIED